MRETTVLASEMFTSGVLSVAQQRRVLKLRNSCNLIGQYLVLLFFLTFDWLMESTFLDGLFKAEANVTAKTIQFILNLDSWQKLIKNISAGNIGF